MPNTISLQNRKFNYAGRLLSPTKPFHSWLIINIISVMLILITSTVYAQSYQYDYNNSNVTIPDAGGWVSSNITISGAPADAVVTGIDVFFKCVHPYSGDLNIDLNADISGNLGNYDLWEREGGSADNPSKTVTGITTFNGLSVNRTWYLYAKDEESGDSGYIDEWSIKVYYTTPTPSISSVSPNPVTGQDSAQPFTIYGSGFTSYSTVTLRDKRTGEVFPDRPISSQSSTHITINPNFTSTAATWSVEVINNGVSSGEFTFEVVAPVVTPSISSVSPNPVTGQDSEQPFTIFGSGFTSYSTVTLRDKRTGEVFPDRPISSQSSTHITINPNFTSTAATWSVEVINNGVSSAEFTFEVVAPIAQSDLIIQNLTVSPNSGVAGSSPTVSFTIRNQGSGTANACTTNIRINTSSSDVTTSDYLLASISTPSIAAGSTYNVDRTVTIPGDRPLETNYIWVIVDVNSTANQSNETNDKAYTTFTVTAAAQSDLIIQNLTVSPNSGVAGSSPTVSFTIRNQGSGTANACTTNIRINTSSSDVTTSDYLLASISTPSIAAGSTYNVNRTVTIPGDRPLGTNYIWVIVDVNSTANQSNETNDKAYTAFTVTVGPAPPPIQVPYIRQAGDTDVPNDSGGRFDGRWACGATSAVMIAAYHQRLSPHSIIVYGVNDACGTHTNDYGWYVSSKDTRYGYTYDEMTEDAHGSPVGSDGNPAYGAYGYIHDDDGFAHKEYARGFFRRHGLFSRVIVGPNEADIKSEIDKGHPVWASTSCLWKDNEGKYVGHIIVIKGYSNDWYYVADPWPFDSSASIQDPCADGSNKLYTWEQMGIESKWIVIADPIASGDRVKSIVNSPFSVMNGPGLNFDTVGAPRNGGDTGTIVDDSTYGPVYNSDIDSVENGYDHYTWWKIKWDDGIEGWSAAGDGGYGENWLEKIGKAGKAQSMPWLILLLP